MIGSTDKELQTVKNDISCDAPTENFTSTDGMQNNTTEPLNDMQVSTEAMQSSIDISDKVVANCSEIQSDNESSTLEHTTERKNTDEPQLSDDIQNGENNIPTKSDNILSERYITDATTTAANNEGAVDCSQTEKIEQLPIQNLSSSDMMSNSEQPQTIGDDTRLAHINEDNDEKVVESTNNNTALDRKADVDDDHNKINEDEFVAIELVSPKNTADGDEQLTSESAAVEHPAQSSIPETKTNPNNNAQEGSISAAQTEPLNNNTNANATTTSLPPPRRKILRHPILTPLTKLPWDRIISGVGNCDVFFNCKYSARQVEDEVREEHTRTIGGHYLENIGHQEDLVGREGGYVNVSLGHEYYGEEEADDCNADEVAQQLGLGCCSMLDSETDEEEVEVVASEELMHRKEEACSEQQEIGKDGEDEGNLEQVNSVQVTAKLKQGDENNQHEVKESSTQPAPASDLLSKDQKANASWKNSNPSLDMMLYRTMMHE